LDKIGGFHIILLRYRNSGNFSWSNFKRCFG